MDEETYAQMPDELEVRELRVTVEQPGFRVNELVLVTTMRDEEAYTKEELADLFLQRWNIELDLRSIKDVLQMDVLRCKTPAMVEKEIWMHLLAYNLIRGVMAEAAEAHDEQPRDLSFKGALQTMTAFQDALRRATPCEREGPDGDDAQGDRQPPSRGPLRPCGTASEQAATQTATLPQRTPRRSSQTIDGSGLMDKPSAIRG